MRGRNGFSARRDDDDGPQFALAAAGKVAAVQGLVTVGIAADAALGGSRVAVPWFGRSLLDRVIATRDPQAVNRAFMVIGFLWLLSVGLGVLRNLVTLSLGQRAIRDIREQVIGHILMLPVVYSIRRAAAT